MHDRECIYDRESDGRKPARKQYVEALERRVKSLESQLAGEKEDSDEGSSTMAGPSSNVMLSPSMGTTGSLRIVRFKRDLR